MNDMRLTRRALGLGGSAAAFAASLPSHAQSGGAVVTTTYPGGFEEAFRQIVVPTVKRLAGIDLTVTPMLAVDQVAKITAARANPPFDVVIFDEGPMLASLNQDIIGKFPAEKAKNMADLPPAFRGVDNFGPVVTVQPVGIAYNPKKVPKPTSWNDLWKREYKGRVGLTGMQSSLGTAYMCEVAKLHGGGEKNFEPAFAKVKELLPNLGALAPSPGALATLFQQGEVDIAPNYYNAVMILKAKGVDIEFAVPTTGSVAVRTSLHIVKNAKNVDGAVAYIDAMLSDAIQGPLMDKPWYFVATSNKVKFPAELHPIFGANVTEMMNRSVVLDWAEINKTRPQLIERFNREVKL
jgi:putative spermidine/putrescine transport system substrate-binding protein